jgi:hypothetical protein
VTPTAVHLLRRLHSAGWQHTRYTTYGIDEHVYTRNRLAIDEQRICLNENTDGWRVEVRIGGRVLSGSGFDVADWDMFAGWLGVFEPAPAPVYRSFAVLSPVIEDREVAQVHGIGCLYWGDEHATSPCTCGAES